MKPKILIVGTVPYNKKLTSRAFESYFHDYKKENLAQIFSNTKTPSKGHCSTLFQITDQRLIKKRFKKLIETGIIYNDCELENEWKDNDLGTKSSFFSKLYRLGSRKFPLNYLLRKVIWNKKLWCTEKLNNWLDEFKPDCVFLSFSDDFFIPQIALYIAKRFDIPIVSSIGDDYYFNYKFSFSPFYHFYKQSYRKLIKQVFTHSNSAIYIGNKIRDKYNSEFGLNGETVYLTSTINRREFKNIDLKHPKIIYCGNIRLGRNESLDEIGIALGKINEEYKIDVYSNENDEKFYKTLKQNKNIIYHGAVSYDQVQSEIRKSDISIVVEGFKKNDVDITRYSLSTKVADSLASGVNVFGYGSIECGAIEYLKETECAIVCTDKTELEVALTTLLTNLDLQRKNYELAQKITLKNHCIQSSTKIFENVVERAIENVK